VAPQLGENIGASARAMKNFGITDLRIVNPRDGWPNSKAINMSVGASDVIHNAKIFSDIKSAIYDLELVYAATAAARDMNKESVLSRDISTDLVRDNADKIGFLFGRENSGLNNEEISYAHKILTIDTVKDFTSLNIAHAVAIICYQLFQNLGKNTSDLSKINYATKDPKPQLSEVENFYDHLFDKLESKNFFRTSEKKNHMSQKIRNLFSRIDNLSKSELQTLRGMITVLTKDERKYDE
jgi:tRNA/rRNA methyltransferase